MNSVQTNPKPQAGKAFTSKTMFSRETSVSVHIEADASIVWALLTHASDFSRWNSTIISIQGEIKQGETIELKSTLDETRSFKLKIKEFVPEKRLVWGDAMGSRVYALDKTSKGVSFTMTEKIGGPLFPLFAKMIPSFDESFDQFAADLKKKLKQFKARKIKRKISWKREPKRSPGN
ncbi:MAG: SRPBCC domain-containing protein [Anaerolineales bacterium]|nr:SRPBCC domain-containing protein [Anaerolineales bacterium]